MHSKPARPGRAIGPTTEIRGCARCLLVGLAMGIATVALAEQTPPAKPRPMPTRPQTAAPRPSTQKPAPKVSGKTGSADRARMEAACVRYRLVWGMDCPTENGSGVGGVDPLRDVRRLPMQSPVGK